MRYVDLFAGCGGMLLGFHRAGWEAVFAVEKDPMAFDTLRTNFIAGGAGFPDFADWPDWLEQRPWDIEQLLADDGVRASLSGLRGSLDLVAGGPPCQGFSVGGARNGGDNRNKLVNHFLAFVELTLPRAVLIENVEGMARRFDAKPGGFARSPADEIVDALAAIGYTAVQLVVDASLFGVPQLRRRLIIFGVRGYYQGLEETLRHQLKASRTVVRRSLKLPVDRFISAREAIEDLDGSRRVVCPDSPKYQSGTYSGPARSSYARGMRSGVSSKHIPDSHRFSVHGDRILSWYRLAHRTQPAGRLSRAFMESLGTKKDKKVLIDPDAPVSTITTHPDEFIHYRHPRNITVREMARFQSFPDTFLFRGRYTINGPRRRFDVARCSQVGNAVPPLLAQGVAMAIEQLLCEKDGSVASESGDLSSLRTQLG